ncbi:hypothetical protein B0H67DRAFT_642783 [Lasiosphaeris hirsuta]|uniref:RNase H type-1 domain-containing protein n=1 Tax=Lasiosphaeris hirsuta TaxID=260670 RepID=A0AA40APA5_9PEZI|nr:hypothetical protein B0H67DRAFT_642783 [Lasiosphaeris hirsuta]
MEILIEAGANVNARPSRDAGATALQLAAAKGHLGVSKRLVNLGANVNAPPARNDGRTALEAAAEHGRIDMAQLLLEHGAQTQGRYQRHFIRAIQFATRSLSLTILAKSSFAPPAYVQIGKEFARAGWAFWYGLDPSGKQLVVAGRLENKGPFGSDSFQSTTRAELRAVIAALRYRYWPSEGFHTVVIATDSEYVVEGSTNWVKGWDQERLEKAMRGHSVMSREFWEALLGEIEQYKDLEWLLSYGGSRKSRTRLLMQLRRRLRGNKLRRVWRVSPPPGKHLTPSLSQ